MSKVFAMLRSISSEERDTNNPVERKSQDDRDQTQEKGGTLSEVAKQAETRSRSKKKPPVSMHLVNGLSGAGAGALAATIVCPLDLAKTRIQTQRPIDGLLKYNGTWGTLRTVFREEGMRGLYKGLSPNLVALLPNWAVYFTVYEGLKTILSKFDKKGEHNYERYMLSSIGAGTATVVSTNPLWVVKTRLQAEVSDLRMGGGVSRSPYKGFLDCSSRLLREEGVKGMYSGLGPALIGVVHVAIQFPIYEYLKASLAQRSGKEVQELGVRDLLVATITSKVVASSATYPHEVLRSRMHVAGLGPFKGVGKVAKQIWKEGGTRAFYRGCATNLIRTTPSAAITMLAFELLQMRMNAYINEAYLADEVASNLN